MVLLPARDAAVVSLFRGFGLSVEILGPLTQLRSHLVPHGDPKQFAASPGNLWRPWGLFSADPMQS